MACHPYATGMPPVLISKFYKVIRFPDVIFIRNALFSSKSALAEACPRPHLKNSSIKKLISIS
jgi:hypothetical protein